MHSLTFKNRTIPGMVTKKGFLFTYNFFISSYLILLLLLLLLLSLGSFFFVLFVIILVNSQGKNSPLSHNKGKGSSSFFHCTLYFSFLQLLNYIALYHVYHQTTYNYK